MPLRLLALLIGFALLLSTACSIRSTSPPRIALLAPFEGRYREIGYDALYAARLALADSGKIVDLNPVDDGGTLETASARARALANDPLTVAVVLLGDNATSSEAQLALGDLPALIVGYWSHTPQTETTWALFSQQLPNEITLSAEISVTDLAKLEAPFAAGDNAALAGFHLLRPPHSFEDISVISSGRLPDPTYAERIGSLDSFASEPGLLSSLTYDAVMLITRSLGETRAVTARSIATAAYDGLNGHITFSGQFWSVAPVNRYTFTSEGELLAP